jgi:hypothetical protein
MCPVGAITSEMDSIDQIGHRPYLEALETAATDVGVLLLLLRESEVLHNKVSNLTMTANTAELCSCIYSSCLFRPTCTVWFTDWLKKG